VRSQPASGKGLPCPVAAQDGHALRAEGHRPVPQRGDGGLGVGQRTEVGEGQPQHRLQLEVRRGALRGQPGAQGLAAGAERAGGRPARYDIRLRGEGAARAVFTIERGALTVGAPVAGPARGLLSVRRPVGVPARAVRPDRAPRTGPGGPDPGLGPSALAGPDAAQQVPQALSGSR